MVIKVMSRAQIEEFSRGANHAVVAVVSLSDSDKESPHLENNPMNGIVYKCRLHFDDVDEGGHHCITIDDAYQIVTFINNIKDTADMLIVHCEAGISRSPGVAAAIMKFLNDDDTPIFDSHSYRPNMTCYRKVLRAFFELCKEC